jgi:NADP-dependent 3-hydroxy acid dehydrogenase YdfG
VVETKGWGHVVDVNLSGMFYIVQAVLPACDRQAMGL